MFRTRAIGCASQPLSGWIVPENFRKRYWANLPNTPLLDDTSKTLTSEERALRVAIFSNQLPQYAPETSTAILPKF